ncbi:MAG: hypothetical protein QXM43_06965 [Desulfurococcaceae archaeon]
MQSNDDYVVYICQYFEAERVISRHFITGLSTCKRTGLIKRDQIEKTLGEEAMLIIEKTREYTVTTFEQIHQILRELKLDETEISSLLSNPYLYILILKN